MGMPFFKVSGCSHPAPVVVVVDRPQDERPQPAGNPNPKNFSLGLHEQHGRFLIVAVTYPDVSTFEGTKILIFENVTWADITQLKFIDPHFCDAKEHISPVARFIPTLKGWDFARAFCRNA